MVSWILTDRNQLPNQRPILASCETFRKRSFVIDQEGQWSENIIYGIASVFVNPSHRRQGYAGRLMHELASALPEWHVGSLRSIGSILYSDIGQGYYTKLGWPAFPVNNHIEFDPMPSCMPPHARRIQTEDLPQLCQDDEAMVRKSMATSPPGRTRIMIVPDIDHMLWHISKEEFACQKIFGNVPKVKGAVAESVAAGSGHYGFTVTMVTLARPPETIPCTSCDLL
jgi:Acetyltransferase (GNAT) family